MKISKHLLIVLLLAFIILEVGQVFAQGEAPDMEWESMFGESGDDIAYSVQQTTDGGYIVGGKKNIIGLNDDIYLVKTDSKGNEEWSRNYGDTDYEAAHSVQQTTDGGYILAGVKGSQFYVVKTSSTGSEEWSRTYEHLGIDAAHTIQQTTDGGYIVAGSVESYQSFGAGGYDFYLLKIDSEGSRQWGKIYGGENYEAAYSVAQTIDGGYILGGFTRSYGNGGSDFYLIKTDSNGNEEWSMTYGGIKDETAHSIQRTSDGGYILTGDTESYGSGGKDFYLVKINSFGEEEWSKTFGGEKFETAYSVEQTDDGGYIIAGQGTTSMGWDVLIVKTDSEGSQLWNKTIGGQNTDEARAVGKTDDGGYIVAGETESYGSGGKDFYLIKLGKDPTSTPAPPTSPPLTEPPPSPKPRLASIVTSTPLQLTKGTANQYEPRWSPDGERIVYVSEQSGNLDIWVMSKDGGRQTQLTMDTEWQYNPVWTPDGEKIVYVSEETGDPDLWIMNVNGTGKIQLTRNVHQEQVPCLSPEGDRIVYTSDQTGNLDLWIMRIDGTEQTQLTDQSDDQYYCDWSPNGDILYVSEEKGTPDIWAMRHNGGSQTQLTNEISTQRFPLWSQKGRNFLYTSTETGTQNIFISDFIKPPEFTLTFRTKLQLLEDSKFRRSYPSISSDGKWLLYQSDENGNWDIYTASIDTKAFPSPETYDIEPTPTPPTPAPIIEPEVAEPEAKKEAVFDIDEMKSMALKLSSGDLKKDDPGVQENVTRLQLTTKEEIKKLEEEINGLYGLVEAGKNIGADVSQSEDKINSAILILKEANISYINSIESFASGDVLMAANQGNEAYVKGTSGKKMLDESKVPLYTAISSNLDDKKLSVESSLRLGKSLRIPTGYSEKKISIATGEINTLKDTIALENHLAAAASVLSADDLLSEAQNRIYMYLGAIAVLLLIAAIIAISAIPKIKGLKKLEEAVSSDQKEQVSPGEIDEKAPGIEVTGFSKKYRDSVILDKVEFTVPRGSLSSIAGLSGGGKSTIIEAIAGRKPPDSGRVMILGKDALKNRRDINRLVGFVPQHPELNMNQTVWENMINSAIKWEISEAGLKSTKLLKEMGILERKEVIAKNLSGGQLKRLSLAMELIREPEILILDEPTSGLDPTSRDRILTALTKIVASNRKTILFTTHFMDEAEHCDKVIVVGEGRILAEGSPSQLAKRLPGAGRVVSITLEEISENLFKMLEGLPEVKKVIREGRVLKILCNNPDPVELSQKVKELGGVVEESKIRKAGMKEVFVYFTGKMPEER